MEKKSDIGQLSVYVFPEKLRCILPSCVSYEKGQIVCKFGQSTAVLPPVMYCTAPHCITVSLSAPASLRTAPNSWLPRTVEARQGVMWSKALSETGDRYILTMLTDFLRRAARFKV